MDDASCSPTAPMPPSPCEAEVRASIEAARNSTLSGVDAAAQAMRIGRHYRSQRIELIKSGTPPRVAVCSWELAHNPAGRAKILADLHAGFAETAILGFLFPRFGVDIWEPLRSSACPPVKAVRIDAEERLARIIVDLVLQNPCDLAHVSKPRMPGILLGLAYRAIWGASVIVDFDDEELAFVKADRPADLDEMLQRESIIPRDLTNTTGQAWTRIAVSLAKEFDGVTVANEPLRVRYGGRIIPHARYVPPPESLASTRVTERFRLGIGPDRVVVLFLGTPRRHKGLVETARLVSRLERREVVFLIVGGFSDATLKREVEMVQGVDVRFLGNQPFERLPAIVAAADIHVSLQAQDSQVASFQTPAKLTDALGGGLAVIGRPTPGSREILDGIGGACETDEDLAVELVKLVRDPEHRRQRGRIGRAWYENHLSVEKHQAVLEAAATAAIRRGPGTFRPKIADWLDDIVGRMLTGK